MGEMKPQELVVTVHLADVDPLVNLGVLLVEALKTLRPEPEPAPDEPEPAQTPYDLGLEPWTFHAPRENCDVVAYVDPQNQLRHVPTTRATEVPKSWRRVWLQPRE